MTYEDYQKMKWLAIYSSYISTQYYHFQNSEARIIPSRKDMERFKKEAKKVADLALEGESS